MNIDNISDWYFERSVGDKNGRVNNGGVDIDIYSKVRRGYGEVV